MEDKYMIPANEKYIKAFQEHIIANRIGGRDYQILLEFLEARDSKILRDEAEKEGGLYNWLEKNGSNEFYDSVFKEFKKNLEPRLDEMLKEAKKRYERHYFSVSRMKVLGE